MQRTISSEHAELNRHCIIIGAMKAGTTSLFAALARHPSICPSAVKEPNFFTDRFEEGLAAYDDGFALDPSHHILTLEASTRHTKAPMVDTRSAAARMRATGRRFDFIYVVRNPVERAASHIRHQIAHGIVSHADRFRNMVHAVNVSQYGRQIGEFRAGFPDARLHVVDFGKLIAQPEDTLAEIVAFLGLPPHPIEGIGRENASPPLADVLSPEQEQRLRDVLRADIEAFGRLTGFDLAAWGF